MATPTTKQLKAQYNRAKVDGWLPWFAEAAEKAGTTTAHFLGIASRETNIKNIRGDFRAGRYNGFGPMQVDVGTDAEFAKKWTADNPEPGIKRGGEIYAEKVRQIIKGQGKRLTVRGNKFTGREAELDDIRRIATAAYNSGLWAYFHFSNHAHVDSTTTGKDYSRDVYRRALEFAEFLEADGEDGAFAREVELMGKYATEDDKARVFQKPSVTEPVTEPEPLPEPEPIPETKLEVPVKPEVTPPAPSAVESTIPAIPPLASHVPAWAKKIAVWGASINLGGLGASFAFFRDNPQALAAALHIIKWTLLGLGVFAAIIVAGVFIGKLYYAKLANDLNMERLRHFSNPDTPNVDFSGWKTQGEVKS
jgi:hypothetical protein